jgi:subtilisin family serine protease
VARLPHRSAAGFEDATGFRVRFVFEADADASTGDGLYIDDVRILGGVTGSALPSDHGVPAPDGHYVFMSGTSMATPLAAGSAALVRQFLREAAGLESPSAALVRAALVTGAYDLTPGQYTDQGVLELPSAPHVAQGWGLLRLPQTVDPGWPSRLGFTDQRVGLATGERHRFKLEITDTTRPIVVTLAYHDYPISGGGLANDLDLSLWAPGGQLYHPNGLGGPDHVNNVERIVVPQGEVVHGTYTLRVDGTEVVYGAPPALLRQPYALAVRAPGDFHAPLEAN